MNNLVIMKDQQAVTSSLQVAENFDKQHKNIMQVIDRKMNSAENSAQYQSMFVEGIYKDRSGKQNKMYYMNRDGFTFIAMGFTGAKADGFKLKYIEAFNKLENDLKQEYSTKNVGGYQVPSNYRGALLLAADLQEQIEAMRPKATYFDQIMASKSLMITTTIAKDYGMSAKAFNDLLKKLKVQYKIGGIWYLYSKYQDNGWVSSSTRMIEGKPRILTKWTQKGRVGLYKLLKEQGIIPMIEKTDIKTVTIGGQR